MVIKIINDSRARMSSNLSRVSAGEARWPIALSAGREDGRHPGRIHLSDRPVCRGQTGGLRSLAFPFAGSSVSD